MNEAQKKGWAEFGEKMQRVVAEGDANSTFIFARVDTLPDGGVVTSALHYQLTVTTHLGFIAHQLQILKNSVDKTTFKDYQHSAGRVLNLFNRLFNADASVANKKELN